MIHCESQKLWIWNADVKSLLQIDSLSTETKSISGEKTLALADDLAVPEKDLIHAQAKRKGWPWTMPALTNQSASYCTVSLIWRIAALT